MSIANASAQFGLTAIGTGTRPLISSAPQIGQASASVPLTASNVVFAASAYLQDSTDTATIDTTDFSVLIDANAAVAATGILTLTGNAVADETVTIGSVTYTWKASVGATANEVLIGASASDSLDNLIDAINLEDGAGESGTLYGSATVIHPTVSALAGTGDTVDLTAKTAGEAGNLIATTETMTVGSFGATTLTAGADANAWDGAGSDFEGVAFAAPSSIEAILIYCESGAVDMANSTDIVIPVSAGGRALLANSSAIADLLGTLVFTASANDTRIYVTIVGTL